MSAGTVRIPKLDVGEDFHTDFKSLMQSLSKIEEGISSYLSPESKIKKENITILDQDIKNCENLYFQLENEFIGIPKNIKSKYSDEMGKFSFRIGKIKRAQKEIVDKFESTVSKDNPKEALLDVNRKMNKGTNTMANSVKVMRGVNSRDNQTMNTLVVQTNNIIEAKDTVSNTETVIGRSEKIVKGLLRRLQSNRLMLIVIMLLLFMIIVLVLYIKIKRTLGFK